MTIRSSSEAVRVPGPVRTDISGDATSLAVNGDLWSVPGQDVHLGSMTHNGGLEYDTQLQSFMGRRRGADQAVLTTETDERFVVAAGHLIDVNRSVDEGLLWSLRVVEYEPVLTIGRVWGLRLDGVDEPRAIGPVRSLHLAYQSRTDMTEMETPFPRDDTLVETQRRLASVGINLDGERRRLFQQVIHPLDRRTRNARPN